MSTRRFAGLFFALALLGSFAPRASFADDPSAEELLARATIVDSDDPGLESAEVVGEIQADAGVRFKFRALYRAPDSFALRIADAVDDAPLLHAAGGRMIVYDPVAPTVMYGEKVRTEFAARIVDGNIRWEWLWNGGGRDEPRRGRLLLDLKSIVSMPAAGHEVTRVGDGEHRLTTTSERGNRLISRIDLARRCPFTRIDLVLKDQAEPVLSFSKIAIDEPLADAEFALPDREKFAEKLTVRDWPGEGVFAGLASMAQLLRAGYARLGANRPDVRDAIKLPDFAKIDWDAVKRNDETYIETLRELIPPVAEKP